MGEPFFLLADTRARLVNSTAHMGGPSSIGRSKSRLMPEAGFEQRTDESGPSYISTLGGSYGNSEARQSTDNQPCVKNVSPEIDFGADNFYGGALDPSGYSQPEYPTVLKTAGSETIATNDCGEACTVAPNQEPSVSFAPDLPNGSSSQEDCTCISCLGIGIRNGQVSWFDGRLGCRFPGCPYRDDYLAGPFYEHEKSHYGQTGKYICLEQTCQVATKNFGDLKRHHKAKHCSNPTKERFPCPVLWCKYSGNNGFARKDKLTSHYKNIHEGKPGPVKAGRIIKPATLKPKVSGLEGSTGKQKE